MSSQESDEVSAMLAATEVDQRAADWLQRRHFWNWSDKDQVALDGWLAASPAHEVAYWRLEAAWNNTQRLAALHRPSVRPISRNRLWPRFVGIAACVAIVVTLGTEWPFFMAKPEIRTVATALGERKTVVLSDGSQIELNTNSALRVAAAGSGRHVWLDKGEAYFDITHDARNPFVVIVGNGRITDLGTKFVVRRGAGHLSIALVEGRARFDASDVAASRPVFLKPGDVIERNGHTIVTAHKTSGVIRDSLGWRRGLLIFKHATLGEAAAEFNRYNGEKIMIADAQTAKIAIGGTFQSNNVTVFANAVRDLLGLHVETRNDETVISR